MLQCLDGSGHVSWHGDVDGTVGVVPVEREAAVEGACPIYGDRVERLEGSDEVLGVLLADVVYPEVVDDESECDWSCAVAEETWGVSGGVVAVGCEVLREAIVCEDSGLGEAIHAFADFGHDVVVVDKGSKVILDHDVGGNVLDGDADVFVLCHWCAKIKIFDVNGHVFCPWRGDHAVEEKLDGGEVGGRSAYVAVVFDAVSSHGEANAFRLGFVWAESGDNAEVSGNAVCGFVVVWDEEEGVGSTCCVRMVSLGQSANFGGGTVDPFRGVVAA